MREGAIRNANLGRSVQALKILQLLMLKHAANQWNHMNEVSAEISMRQRKLVKVSWRMDAKSPRPNLPLWFWWGQVLQS